MPASSRFLRFCIIGSVSAVGSLSLFYVLNDWVGIGYMPAFILTFVVANSLAYTASRRFAFAATQVGRRQGLLRYLLVALCMLGLNTMMLRGLVGGLGLWPTAAAAVLCVANAPLNYLLHRTLTFAVGSVAH